MILHHLTFYSYVSNNLDSNYCSFIV